MIASTYEIGRLLRAGTTGCVVGTRASQATAPAFGALVRIPLTPNYAVYGLIYDIHIDDDGLVRQLVTTADVPQEVILDNRENRNVPLEISVLFTGYEENGRVSHLLPPRPPLTLDVMYACSAAETVQFTAHGRFGYLRHVLRAQDLPIGELVASHLGQARGAHAAAGNPGWWDKAVRELVVLLRDDYPTLMSVLGALADAGEE